MTLPLYGADVVLVDASGVGTLGAADPEPAQMIPTARANGATASQVMLRRFN